MFASTPEKGVYRHLLNLGFNANAEEAMVEELCMNLCALQKRVVLRERVCPMPALSTLHLHLSAWQSMH